MSQVSVTPPGILGSYQSTGLRPCRSPLAATSVAGLLMNPANNNQAISQTGTTEPHSLSKPTTLYEDRMLAQ